MTAAARAAAISLLLVVLTACHAAAPSAAPSHTAPAPTPTPSSLLAHHDGVLLALVNCGLNPGGHPTAIIRGVSVTKRPFYGEIRLTFRLGASGPRHTLSRRAHYTPSEKAPHDDHVLAHFTWQTEKTDRTVHCSFSGRPLPTSQGGVTA
ncbi:MAG TPA: hypothetical protein VME70_14790 [Mycobacteriales bacterium]|nr:hypothetical protein [Mycobacteriales bacterium]